MKIHIILWHQGASPSWVGFCAETGKTYREAARWFKKTSEERRDLLIARIQDDVPKCSWFIEARDISPVLVSHRVKKEAK